MMRNNKKCNYDQINNACKTPNSEVCIVRNITIKMYVRNTKRHKIREIKDQSTEIIKNNLKINEEHNAYIRKMPEE